MSNTTDVAEVYTLGHQAAVATAGTGNDWGYYLSPAEVTFSAEHVTVPAGGSATVDVTVTSPEEGYLFGGFVTATGTDGSSYTLPYGGASFDLQDVEVLTDLVNGDGTTAVELPALGVLESCARFLGVDCVDPDGTFDLAGADHVYTMDQGDVPLVLIHLEHQARALDMEVFAANEDGTKGDSLGLVREIDYLARHAGINGIEAYSWDGMVVNESGARERVADGDYILEVVLTKASAWNDDTAPATETWTSQAFGIAWSGTGLVDAPTVSRAQGIDRYSTAAELAVENFDTGVETVFVASGEMFPDALAGGAVAGAEGAPVLLVRSGAVPAPTRTALGILQPQQIVVLGGEQAVSEAVLDRLAAYAPVTRIAGANRYETSVALSSGYAAGVDLVFLASGVDFPDALSASAAAGMEGAPVLLTKPDSLPGAVRAELDRLDPAVVVVVGGKAAVSEAVKDAVETYTDDVVRIAGANRYETSAAIATEFFPTPADHAIVATGLNFADALAAGPVAAGYNSPVLLTKTDVVPSAILGAITELRVQEITIAGGLGAVAMEVQETLEALVYP
ncbi:cell wall-binding repeat-containing protein [Ornithinimicrobium tianjinense]|uniref:C5a peptidase/Subtilisin-like protease SBT2-like Fn3-like domain-containing protein n=1 Tax=Ornithinimicrobium tianjinense TaxID=1195761 RepID=A0A917BNX9_9MICO|nr:cell wall-binding repeat-containing protein [Ornithinimicrobium tianjinense]GGF53501.1 hypothetical protein GCM10011366_21600 [Ornithinimicrobium tianjinense]